MPTNQNGRVWTCKGHQKPPPGLTGVYAVAEREKLEPTLPSLGTVLGREQWGDCSQPALVVALGAFRFPKRVARPRGLGNLKMTKKTTVTIDVTFDVAATARWICLMLTVLLA